MTTRRRRPAVTLPALLLATALSAALGACSDGGGDDRSGGDGGGAAGAGDDAPAEGADTGACALLSAEEVSGFFGEEARAVPPEGAPVTCVWEAGSADGLPSQQLQVSLYEGQEPISAGEYGEGAEAIEGVGDDAFVTDGPLGPTAVANLGDTSLMLIHVPPLAGEGAGDEGGDAPAGRSDDLVGLLTVAAERAAT